MLFFGSLLDLSLAYFFQEKDVVLTSYNGNSVFWAAGLVAGYGGLLLVLSYCSLIGSTFRVVM